MLRLTYCSVLNISVFDFTTLHRVTYYRLIHDLCTAPMIHSDRSVRYSLHDHHYLTLLIKVTGNINNICILSSHSVPAQAIYSCIAQSVTLYHQYLVLQYTLSPILRDLALYLYLHYSLQLVLHLMLFCCCEPEYFNC